MRYFCTGFAVEDGLTRDHREQQKLAPGFIWFQKRTLAHHRKAAKEYAGNIQESLDIKCLSRQAPVTAMPGTRNGSRLPYLPLWLFWLTKVKPEEERECRVLVDVSIFLPLCSDSGTQTQSTDRTPGFLSVLEALAPPDVLPVLVTLPFALQAGLYGLHSRAPSCHGFSA